jgi:hypothetical protein
MEYQHIKTKNLTFFHLDDILIYKIKITKENKKSDIKVNQNIMYSMCTHLAALEHNLQVRQEKNQYIQNQFVSKSQKLHDDR